MNTAAAARPSFSRSLDYVADVEVEASVRKVTRVLAEAASVVGRVNDQVGAHAQIGFTATEIARSGGLRPRARFAVRVEGSLDQIAAVGDLLAALA